MKKYGMSLAEIMIAVAILAIGLAVVFKMFGKSGYMVGKSKWELLAMSIANGEIEKATLYSGDFENLKKCAYDWKSLDDSDFPVNNSIPIDYKNAEFQKRLKVEIVNNFIAKVTVNIKWHEMTTSGKQWFRFNLPTIISNPKYFNKYK